MAQALPAPRSAGVFPCGRTWEAWPNHRAGPRLPALRLCFHTECSIHRLFHQCAERALLGNEIIILQCDDKEASVMLTYGSSCKKLRLVPFWLVLVVTLQFRLCANRAPPPPLLTGCAARGTGRTCSAVRGVLSSDRTWEAWSNHRVGPRSPAL